MSLKALPETSFVICPPIGTTSGFPAGRTRLVLNVAFGIRALDVDSLVFFHHWGIPFFHRFRGDFPSPPQPTPLHASFNLIFG